MLEAGTTWLYNQLRNHDAFWMAPLKELHFLDGAYPSKELQARLRRFNLAGEGTYDPRDTAYFEFAQEHPEPTEDLDVYAGLFAPKAGLLSGDIAPRHGTLDEDKIARIAARFPHLRIAIIVRDPVARHWAQSSRAAASIEHHNDKLTDAAAFAPWATGRVFTPFSYPTRTVEAWRRHFPKNQLHVFFYEDLVSRPAWFRDKITRFIGGPKAVPGARLPVAFTPDEAPPLPEAHRDVLVGALGEEVVAAAKMFGEHAKAWPGLYGLAVPRATTAKPRATSGGSRTKSGTGTRSRKKKASAG